MAKKDVDEKLLMNKMTGGLTLTRLMIVFLPPKKSPLFSHHHVKLVGSSTNTYAWNYLWDHSRIFYTKLKLVPTMFPELKKSSWGFEKNRNLDAFHDTSFMSSIFCPVICIIRVKSCIFICTYVNISVRKITFLKFPYVSLSLELSQNFRNFEHFFILPP